MNIAVFNKDPGDRLDYGFDWSEWLGSDTISTSTWSLDEGITKYSDSKDSTTTTIWLTGGTHGTDYYVTNEITTTGGRIKQRSLKIQVREQ